MQLVRQERNRTCEGGPLPEGNSGDSQIMAALMYGPNGQITTLPLRLGDVRVLIWALATASPPSRRTPEVRRLLAEFGHVEEQAELPWIERQLAQYGRLAPPPASSSVRVSTPPERLKRARLAAGLTLRQVARQVHMCEWKVRNIEYATPFQRARVAEVLGVEVSELEVG